MKKILAIVSVVLVAGLSGCAAIQKQVNINKQMEHLVINAPAEKVFRAAVKVMNNMMFVQIRPEGRLEGASRWVVKPARLGTKYYKERTRFTIKVIAQSENKSMLRIFKERSSNLMGDWNNPLPGRLMSYEFNVLKKLNPARAAKIDKMAAAK